AWPAEAGKLRVSGGEPVEQLASRCRRLIRHMIAGVVPFGMPEINYRVYEGITAHDQSGRACECDRHVTLRVSGRVNDAQSGDDFIACLDHLPPVCDGRVVAAGAGD